MMANDEGRSADEKAPTPSERFVSLARKVTQTPKAEVEKREAKWRDKRRKDRTPS
jgi:hypothetical protein